MYEPLATTPLLRWVNKPAAMTTVRWPSHHGPFEITLGWTELEGTWTPVGMDIRTIDQRPLTPSMLRSLPLGRIIDKAWPVAYVSSITAPEADGTIYTSSERHGFGPKPTGGRPPKYGPEHFAKVAQVYRDAFARNRTPTRAVARHFRVSPSAAAKWVARCRDLHLLPETTKGKARVLPPAKPKRKRRKG